MDSGNKSKSSLYELLPLLVIIGAPILRTFGFSFGFVENILTRILFVGALIYAALIKKNPFFAILTFLAVFTLLIERNQALLSSLPNQKPILKPIVEYQKQAILSNPFTHIKETIDFNEVESKADASNLDDNIPDLKEGPSNSDAPTFFKDNGLA